MSTDKATKATFASHNPDIRSTFPITATGYMLNVNLPGDIASAAIMVDDADFHAVERLLDGEINGYAGVQVTNLLNRQIVTLKRADCGAGCRCALRFVKNTW
jgi:hypothetical protein